MKHRALYQKHRPTRFKDVIEQPQVITVLEKAVKGGATAHAYLFTGPRGIGKTSVARIFAQELGCKEIDVFEIDAASHTSVENIRDITNSVYTQPVESAHKVYILDEVHMLSKAAFNAFLKTLEEPPAHAIFVLITTEAEKVPDTIVSRCVTLQFRQPSLITLKKSAIQTAKKEGYKLSSESATLIALISEGSFRDMLTSVQKVLFISDDSVVVHKKVEEVLGAPKQESINEYLIALIAGDVENGIRTLTEMAKANINILLFAKLCIQKLRAALLLSKGALIDKDDYTKEEMEFIVKLSKSKNLSLDILKNLVEATYTIPRSYVKTLPLEYLLLEEK